jgi:hypothetical protein
MPARIVLGLFLATLPAFCDWDPQLAANYAAEGMVRLPA